MLDDFVQEQRIEHTILKNAVEKKQHVHAYLFETNGYNKANELALAFAKYLSCPHHYSNYHQCNTCNQCKLIEEKLFSEIKIIEPDGLWIKKEQLDELQKEFVQTAVQSQNRIYIIQNAEKMNIASQNSILKFLEEPESNIIAILVTDNMYQLLDTIVSRCQVISFTKVRKNNENMTDKIMSSIYIPNTVDKLEFHKYIEIIINFVKFYENKKLETLLNTQSLWHAIINDRDKMLMSFELLILLYKDILNLKLGRHLEFYIDFAEELECICSKNTVQLIILKLKIINDYREKIKLNMNQNLLIDEFLLEMSCVGCKK